VHPVYHVAKLLQPLHRQPLGQHALEPVVTRQGSEVGGLLHLTSDAACRTLLYLVRRRLTRSRAGLQRLTHIPVAREPKPAGRVDPFSAVARAGLVGRSGRAFATAATGAALGGPGRLSPENGGETPPTTDLVRVRVVPDGHGSP
jgi:hypothetical protein